LLRVADDPAVTTRVCALLRMLSRDRQCIEMIVNEQLMRAVVEALTSMQGDNHCWAGMSVHDHGSSNCFLRFSAAVELMKMVNNACFHSQSIRRDFM
jgi:hypothetical protein